MENFERQHNESVILKKNTIQGLYPEKNCGQSFWTLKAKIELAVFKKTEKNWRKTKKLEKNDRRKQI